MESSKSITLYELLAYCGPSSLLFMLLLPTLTRTWLASDQRRVLAEDFGIILLLLFTALLCMIGVVCIEVGTQVLAFGRGLYIVLFTRTGRAKTLRSVHSHLAHVRSLNRLMNRQEKPIAWVHNKAQKLAWQTRIKDYPPRANDRAVAERVAKQLKVTSQSKYFLKYMTTYAHLSPMADLLRRRNIVLRMWRGIVGALVLAIVVQCLFSVVYVEVPINWLAIAAMAGTLALTVVMTKHLNSDWQSEVERNALIVLTQQGGSPEQDRSV